MIRDIPLRFLLPGIIFLVGIATLVSALLFEWQAAQRRLASSTNQHVRVVGTVLSGQIESFLKERNTDNVHTTIESLQADTDLVKAAVLDADYQIISTTEENIRYEDLDKSNFTHMRELARYTRRVGHAVLKNTSDNRMLAVFPLRPNIDGQSFDPEDEGYLIMEYNMGRQASKIAEDLITSSGYWITSIAALSILLWYFINSHLLKRLQRLGILARRIGEGDFSNSLDDKRKDELGDLAREFDTMSRDLERNTRELAHQAMHDNLTGLVNRWGFERELEILQQRLAYDQRDHAIIHIDLDQFRVINETWGHTAGDEMIRQLAHILNERVFFRDIIARIGGDEFGMLLEDCPINFVSTKAEEFRKVIQDFRFRWQDEILRTTASLGVVPVTPEMADVKSLFSLADAACYAAKLDGRNRIHIWQEGDETLERVHGEMRWISRIHSALEEDRFLLHAEPIVPLEKDDGRISYEILVRMRDEDGEMVPPGEFLIAAERYHLISSIDRWVIKNTISNLADRPDHLERLEMCCINLSGLSLNDRTLFDFIKETLEDTDRSLARYLCFELTETAAITHLGQAVEFIRRIKGLGCRFALDDFGSGVSSFGYLKNLPVDYIKIDGIFVRDMLEDPVDRAVVVSINEIAHKMGKHTIAEFAESDAIIQALTDIQVDFAQGYAIERDKPLAELIGPV